MKNILVITSWVFEEFLQQTPGNNGVWGDCTYHVYSHIEDVDTSIKYDYLVIIYTIPAECSFETIRGNTCFITQEPPYPSFIPLKKVFRYFDHVITQFPVRGKHIHHNNPLIPWWIGKSYDYLSETHCNDKSGVLSWITSNKNVLPGHKIRLAFKEELDNSGMPYELFGKGYTYIENKWEGLAPYRYSLAIENGSFRYYWTEKLADCFLTETMPIYYGCPNIIDYFPGESIIRIDINHPAEAIEIIKSAISNKLWEKRRDAIIRSKQLVLNKYQFFPFMTEFINNTIKHGPRVMYDFPLSGWPKENVLEKTTRKLKGLFK